MGSKPLGELKPGPNRGRPVLRLESFLPYRLNVLATVVSEALARIYEARYGFGIPEWRVLATLGQFGTLTGKQIGDHAHMHKTKVSRAVANLEARGILERRANLDDKREVFLSLTMAGRTTYDDLVPQALSFSDALEAALTPADRKVLDSVLLKLMTQSQALAQEPPIPSKRREVMHK